MERVSSIVFLYNRKKLLGRHTPTFFLSLFYLALFSFLHIVYTIQYLLLPSTICLYTLCMVFLPFMFNQSPSPFTMYLSSSLYVSPVISLYVYVCINGYIAGTETGMEWVSDRVTNGYLAYRIIAFTTWYLSLGTSYRLSTLSCLP